VVQAILAALGEADNPDKVDYYTLNKEQPLHLDIDANPDQIELDSEEFQDEVEDNEENIILEEEEKVKATESPLSKVCASTVKSSYFSILMFMLAMLHHKQNCFVAPATEEVSEMCSLNLSQKEFGEQGQARGLGSHLRCSHTLELHTCNDSSS
jgi:hypothetical protein